MKLRSKLSAIAISLLSTVALSPFAALADETEKTEDILTHLGSYSTGYSDAEGGVAEIVAYNSDNKKFYLVNGREKKIDIVSLQDIREGETHQELTLEKRVDVSTLIPDFTFGDITSVSVNCEKQLVAVAVQAQDYKTPGAILLLDYNGGYLAHYNAGVQPDMVTFSPDGKYVLSADEGEPREGYGGNTVDPQGSVTIVDLAAKTAKTVTFEDWDSKRDELINSNVILKQGINPSRDFEPEYIAVDSQGKTAYVALQEANAIAALDIEQGEFTAINSLGFKDHSQAGNEIDVVKDKAVNITGANLQGVYMPDGITIYENHGNTYILTANEGDASEWGQGENEYTNLTEVEVGVDEKGKKAVAEVLDNTKLEGLPDNSANYILGGRSFSIYQVTDARLTQIFDSGSDFERITAAAYPEYFNASNKNNKLDSRSDAKGPEPESVALMQVEDKTYAVIGLERIGGIMVYDITDPADAKQVNYLNSRDFTVDFPDSGTDPRQGDISPEGICTVEPGNSPTGTALILTANEVSGTVTLCQFDKDVKTVTNQDGSVTKTVKNPGKGITTATTTYTDGVIVKTVTAKDGGITAAVTLPDNLKKTQVTIPVFNMSNDMVLYKVEGDKKTILPKTAAGENGLRVTLTESAQLTVAANPKAFNDVKENSWAKEAISFVTARELFIGTAQGIFEKDSPMARSMMATVIHRLEGEPQGGENIFPDVDANSWYGKAVAWAGKEGIVEGDGQGFKPEDHISREEIVTMVYRYAKYLDMDMTADTEALKRFPDAPDVADWAVAAMTWAVDKGIIQGMPNGEIDPEGTATRGHLAAIFQRLINLM